MIEKGIDMWIKLYLIILFLLLFMGANVIDKIGVNYNQYLMSLVVIAFPLSLKRVKEIVKIRPQFFLLIYLTIYYFIRVFIIGGEGSVLSPSLILGAPLLYSIFPFYTHIDQRIFKKVFFVLIAFFLTEVLIAIFEKIQGTAVFGWVNNGSAFMTLGSGNEFRSVALLGHPLQNALTVSILMSFILTSPLKKKYKYTLWMLGFISILCFNTRAAIVGNVLVFLFYYIYNIKSFVKSHSLSNLFIGIVCIFSCVYFVLYTDLGGRLKDMGLFDENSAQVRVDVWSIFDYFPLNDFLWGISPVAKDLILYKTGLYATENFWIDWLFTYGLIFLIPFVISYFCWIKYLYGGYSRISIIITLSTFLLIASTNNSLSVTFIPVFVFLFCVKIFNPTILKKYMPIKYVE